MSARMERSWRHDGHYSDCVPEVVCHCPIPRLVDDRPVRTLRMVPGAGCYLEHRDAGDETDHRTVRVQKLERRAARSTGVTDA